MIILDEDYPGAVFPNVLLELRGFPILVNLDREIPILSAHELCQRTMSLDVTKNSLLSMVIQLYLSGEVFDGEIAISVKYRFGSQGHEKSMIKKADN
jgi:hypothetical protein